MDVKTWYIPKSKKGREVAQLLREKGYKVKNKEVLGRYVANLPIPLDPRLAVSIAYVLDPEYTAGQEHWAFREAEYARQEGDEEYADRLEAGWWALGM